MNAATVDGFSVHDVPKLLKVVRTQTEIARLGLDLGAVMHLAASRAQRLTGATGAVLELAEGDEMVYRATSGAASAHLGLRLPREGSLSGLCMSQGQALVCEDVATDPRVNADACRRMGLQSMVVMPLRHEAGVVGVIKVFSDRPHAFGAADVRLLGLVSELIAASMFYASKHQSENLVVQATTDALTHLPNRALFYERMNKLLTFASEEGMRFGVVSVDMNHLKTINDRWGHRAGDAALIELAGRLRRAVRATDTVARLGGDEFAVLVTHVGNVDKTRGHIARLQPSLEGAFAFEGHELPLGASVGLAVYPLDGTTIPSLVDVADQAMYAMKRASRQGR